MPLYECTICKFSTKLHGNYIRHLNTKKHKRLSENSLSVMVMSSNEHKMSSNEHKMSKMSTKEYTIQTNQKKFICDYCDYRFTTMATKRRHELHFCKSNEALNIIKIKKLENEKKGLRKEIEHLLTKVGNNNNNTTNNIIIVNSFGKENLDYINDEFIKKITKEPYGAIPKLLRTIHFHPKFPENHNVKITNIKLPYASVWNKKTWEMRNKKEVIDHLVNKSCNILDCTIAEKSFTNFMKKYENDEETSKNIDKETELMVINETKKLD